MAGRVKRNVVIGKMTVALRWILIRGFNWYLGDVNNNSVLQNNVFCMLHKITKSVLFMVNQYYAAACYYRLTGMISTKKTISQLISFLSFAYYTLSVHTCMWFALLQKESYPSNRRWHLLAGTALVMSLLLVAIVTIRIYIQLNPDNRCLTGEEVTVSALSGTEEVSYHNFRVPCEFDMISVTTIIIHLTRELTGRINLVNGPCSTNSVHS